MANPPSANGHAALGSEVVVPTDGHQGRSRQRSQRWVAKTMRHRSPPRPMPTATTCSNRSARQPSSVSLDGARLRSSATRRDAPPRASSCQHPRWRRPSPRPHRLPSGRRVCRPTPRSTATSQRYLPVRARPSPNLTRGRVRGGGTPLLFVTVMLLPCVANGEDTAPASAYTRWVDKIDFPSKYQSSRSG